jgi:hypothetical protein
VASEDLSVDGADGVAEAGTVRARGRRWPAAGQDPARRTFPLFAPIWSTWVISLAKGDPPTPLDPAFAAAALRLNDAPDSLAAIQCVTSRGALANPWPAIYWVRCTR